MPTRHHVLRRLLGRLRGPGSEEHDAGRPAGPLFELVTDALTKHASDIHISTASGGAELSLRIDGHVERLGLIDSEAAARLLGQIRVFGNLPSGVLHGPVDATVRVPSERGPLDIRVCLAKSAKGEDVALRLLNIRRF